MATGEDVEDLLGRTKKISRQELRSKTSGGGRSTKFAKYKKLALSLEPGGAGAEVDKLTESQVSSIRTQINHLNPDDADDEEKEFVATRRKMTNDADEDIKDDEGNQLYYLFISREEVNEQQQKEKKEEERQETTNKQQSTTEQTNAAPLNDSKNGESKQEEVKTEAEEDWERVFGE